MNRELCLPGACSGHGVTGLLGVCSGHGVTGLLGPSGKSPTEVTHEDR